MKITAIADLHGCLPKLSGGDLLIVAGDLTAKDKIPEYKRVFDWINKQKYLKKVVIGGNHDNFLAQSLSTHDAKILNLWDGKPDDYEYLWDSGTHFEGVYIWGTPWSLKFPRLNPLCAAFTGDEVDLKKHYDKIPNDVDILISHSPFHGILDQNVDGYLCGSHELRRAVDRVKPRLFVCGHIHEQGGNQLLYKHVGPNTWCVNASFMNAHYIQANDPIDLEIDFTSK